MAPPPKGRKRKRKAALFTPRKKADVMTPERAEINRIIAGGYDYGDRELAFQTLGMNSTPNADYILPSINDFLILINAMLARLHPEALDLTPYPQADQRNIWFRARQACEMVLMAIRTIGGFQNKYWAGKLGRNSAIVVNMGDIRPGATWDNSNPMTAAQFAAHKAGLGPVWVRAAAYEDPRLDAPTTNEVIKACWHRVRAQTTNAYMAQPMQLRQIFGEAVMMREYATMGDGNCFWYALSETSTGIGGWQGFAQIKANLRKFLMSVLNDPTHPRHRTYCYLQQASRIPNTRKARDPHNRGELSFIRSLHACGSRQHTARWPIVGHDYLWPANQIFADYYGVELAELQDPIDDPNSMLRIFSRPLIRGRRTNGLQPHRPQVWIFRDEYHATAGQPPLGAQRPFRLNLPRNRGDLVSRFPWHPNDRTTMTGADLPTRLSRRYRFDNPATRASQAEVNHVLANRDFPDMMPELPLTRDQMDAQWTNSQLNTGAAPFPGGIMPTYSARLYRACYGNPPHGNIVPNERGNNRRDWVY